MVKLILFEYRKHFLKRSILVAVLLFSILNVAKIYSLYEDNSLLSASTDPLWKGLYWQMYTDFGGTMTDEKIKKLMSIYRPLANQTADHTASRTNDNPNTFTGNVYNDYYFFRWCYVLPMEYAYKYQKMAQDVVTAANDNMDFFTAVGNEYEYRKNAAIAERFTGRAIPDFSYTEMYQYYVHYDFSAFLVLLICLYGIVNVFVSEKETEMDALLLTAQSGGTKTVAAKLIATALYICLVCGWLWLLDFAAFSVMFGSWEGDSSPLYALENFANTPLNISLGQYALLSGVVKTAGMFVLGLAFLLVSCLFKNALLPYVISLFATFGCIFMQEAYTGSGHVLIKIINPFLLVVNRELFRNTEFVNLCGLPVPSFVTALLCAAAWGAVCVAGIAIAVRKNTFCRQGGIKRVAMDL
ncbi:ABC transporter permease [Paenibacillus popilliae]|uniref:ABC transporter permease n=1 Tax=Paenibacillus popilliae ATCC 14706 TaxID=1212764 RepID=M9LXY7_PAEPP|nr:ABC transporter permease [Paenibacillus popilliae]GAC40924.1 hypothetical protein PPOP_0264 [Paenibacillus popilliae ATCC 14706]